MQKTASKVLDCVRCWINTEVSVISSQGAPNKAGVGWGRGVGQKLCEQRDIWDKCHFHSSWLLHLPTQVEESGGGGPVSCHYLLGVPLQEGLK